MEDHFVNRDFAVKLKLFSALTVPAYCYVINVIISLLILFIYEKNLLSPHTSPSLITDTKFILYFVYRAISDTCNEARHCRYSRTMLLRNWSYFEQNYSSIPIR